MTTIFLVAVCSMGIGVGLSYLMLGSIIQAERRRAEVYPAIRDERPPMPVCAPNRHNTLTGAYQDATQEIRRDELAEVRQPAPVATVSRYNVIDKFSYLEVRE